MRVLLVEDDADLSRQLKTALGDAGYAVDHAPDGEEAHFLGDTEPYDVIVLDLGLPKIDGVSVLDVEALARPCGPSEGPYAEYPVAALVLHINREALHHGAEILLLRDLYRRRATLRP